MKFVIIAPILLLTLTSCTEAIFEPSATPDIVGYSKETQVRAAKEIQKLKCDPRLNDPAECEAPTLVEMNKDYGVMRDQVRAMKGE